MHICGTSKSLVRCLPSSQRRCRAGSCQTAKGTETERTRKQKTSGGTRYQRTCKYRPGYPANGFKNLEEARLWVLEFVHWYNHQHKHSGINFVTPAQRHTGKDKEVLENRKRVYELAKERHPQRWTGSTRDWTRKDEVWLNPEHSKDEPKPKKNIAS